MDDFGNPLQTPNLELQLEKEDFEKIVK